MKPSIEVTNLSFAYKTLSIFENVSFNIPKNTFVGLIGPNGGGKTTLLKLLMGFLKPQAGNIHLSGNTPLQIRKQIGYVPQVNMYDPLFPITVKELVLLGCVSHHKFGRGYPKDSLERGAHAIETMGLGPYENMAFGSLSGGLAQRALIARSLASDPEYLFLDEPTANVDTKTKDEIIQALFNLKKSKTILMVTHDLNTVIEYVDSVMSVEKKVTIYRPEEVCEHFTIGLYHTPLVKDTKNELH